MSDTTKGEPRDCRYMAAMGLEVKEGVIRSIADRETVIERLKAMMKIAADVYQDGKGPEYAKHTTDPVAKATLHRLRDEFQNNADDPVREAIQQGFALFRIIANEIFAEDPPTASSVTGLPADTFAEVPFFYDIELIAKEVGYNLSVFGSPEDIKGEISESSYNYNQERRGGASGGASGNTQPEPSPLERSTPNGGVSEQAHIAGAIGGQR